MVSQPSQSELCPVALWPGGGAGLAASGSHGLSGSPVPQGWAAGWLEGPPGKAAAGQMALPFLTFQALRGLCQQNPWKPSGWGLRGEVCPPAPQGTILPDSSSRVSGLQTDPAGRLALCCQARRDSDPGQEAKPAECSHASGASHGRAAVGGRRLWPVEQKGWWELLKNWGEFFCVLSD